MLRVKVTVDGVPTIRQYGSVMALAADLEEDIALALRDADRVSVGLIITEE